MVTQEGKYPKLGGDPPYNSEYNGFKEEIQINAARTVINTLSVATNGSQLYPSYNAVGEVFSSATGKTQLINTGSTTANHDTASGGLYELPTASTWTGSYYPENSVGIDNGDGWTDTTVISGLSSGCYGMAWRGKRNVTQEGYARGILYYVGGGSLVGGSYALSTSYVTYNLENPTKQTPVVSGVIQSKTDFGAAQAYYTISGVMSGLDISPKEIWTNITGLSYVPTSYTATGNNEENNGTVEYEVSFDGGATFESAVSANTLAGTDTTGSQLVIKCVISGGGGYDSMPKVFNYGVGFSNK